MIPKTIHYCWFGKGRKSKLNKKCMDSWHKVLPDYTIKVWDETNSPLDNAYCRAAYAQKRWSRLSNYIRLHALHTEGGIYLDTDVEMLKKFEPFLHHTCFIGFQLREEQVDWVNTAVMGATPGHQFIQQFMDLTQKSFMETGKLYRSPMLATKILKEMGLKKYGLQEVQNVAIYPIDYFYPYPWLEQFSADCITENTCCIHHWEGTWLKKKRRLPSLQRIIKKLSMLIPKLKWLQPPNKSNSTGTKKHVAD
jgi:mannosyltransferase OCH1-like enzyme